MDFPNWVQALPFILLNLVNRYFHFLIQAWPFFLFLLLDRLFYHFFKTELGEFYPFRPKTANLLFLGRNEFCKRSAISDLSDERILEIQRPPYSRLSIMGESSITYMILENFGQLVEFGKGTVSRGMQLCTLWMHAWSNFRRQEES
ncbi:uncharacterized protein LOC112005612 [Quercus suber]|uniref:uncharacterized protein LOC112005612 n=1 Tax=Quercus suber TaxID=58331 RepID=UPI0032DFBB6C